MLNLSINKVEKKFIHALIHFLSPGFVPIVTRWLLHAEQELLSLSGHLSSTTVFSGVRGARFLVHCLFFFVPFSFSFGHSISCPSSNLGF